MEVAHPTDVNFHLDYSAVRKCQDNFRFKVRNDNTFALKIYIKLIKFIILFPSPSGETPSIYLSQEIRFSLPLVRINIVTLNLMTLLWSWHPNGSYSKGLQ